MFEVNSTCSFLSILDSTVCVSGSKLVATVSVFITPNTTSELFSR